MSGRVESVQHHPCTGNGANEDVEKKYILILYEVTVVAVNRVSEALAVLQWRGEKTTLWIVWSFCEARTVMLREIMRNIPPCRC